MEPFLFSKGTVNDFRYKNLSGGEKAAFDLLLDFIVKSETYNDTVFCIDEPELHMHSKLLGEPSSGDLCKAAGSIAALD